MKRNIFSELRMKFAGIAAGAFACVWWAVLYPELCFPEDTYDIIYEMEEEDISGDESRHQLLRADEEQIVIRSRLLEWIKQHQKQ